MDKVQYAPYADENPWRLDTFMNVEEWKEVSRWYPFSLRSLMPDGRWYEYSRSKMRDDAYQIMKALATTSRGRVSRHARAAHPSRQTGDRAGRGRDEEPGREKHTPDASS